jgi:hypothetical protein
MNQTLIAEKPSSLGVTLPVLSEVWPIPANFQHNVLIA